MNVRWLTMLLLGLPLSACGPYFHAETPPPIGKTALLDTEDAVLTVSQGAAIAFSCSHVFSATYCDFAEATSEDPEIAQVRPAHLHELRDSLHGPKPPKTFVAYGVSPGQTRIRVSVDGSDDYLFVTVEP